MRIYQKIYNAKPHKNFFKMTIYYAGHWKNGGPSTVYKVSYSRNTCRIYFWDRRGVKTVYYYSRYDIGDTYFQLLIDLAEQGKGLNGYLDKSTDVFYYKKEQWS